MDPTSGKLFGVIGNAGSSKDTSVGGLAAADAVVLSWYTLKWLKAQASGEEVAVGTEAGADAAVATK